MTLFNRLPGFPGGPAGCEREILRRLPAVAVGGTLLLSLGLICLRCFGAEGFRAPLSMPEIYLISLFFSYWSLLLTIAIAAFIVLVMKGPGYVADAYPLPDDEGRA